MGYIRNEAKKFKVFVESRVQLVRENSDVNQWRYIETKKHPADHTSRGLTLFYSKKVKSWKSGLEFLWEEESKWPSLEDQVPYIANGDQEVEITFRINVVRIEDGILSNMVGQISNDEGICEKDEENIS